MVVLANRYTKLKIQGDYFNVLFLHFRYTVHFFEYHLYKLFLDINTTKGYLYYKDVFRKSPLALQLQSDGVGAFVDT